MHNGCLAPVCEVPKFNCSLRAGVHHPAPLSAPLSNYENLTASAGAQGWVMHSAVLLFRPVCAPGQISGIQTACIASIRPWMHTVLNVHRISQDFFILRQLGYTAASSRNWTQANKKAVGQLGITSPTPSMLHFCRKALLGVDYKHGVVSIKSLFSFLFIKGQLWAGKIIHLQWDPSCSNAKCSSTLGVEEETVLLTLSLALQQALALSFSP